MANDLVLGRRARRVARAARRPLEAARVVPEAQRAEVPASSTTSRCRSAALPRFYAEAQAAVLALVPTGRLVGLRPRRRRQPSLQRERCRWAATLANSWPARPSIHEAVHGIVRRYRGSISAEHGIGRLKREALAQHKGAVELDVIGEPSRMHSTEGILNPGKVLPDPEPGREEA